MALNVMAASRACPRCHHDATAKATAVYSAGTSDSGVPCFTEQTVLAQRFTPPSPPPLPYEYESPWGFGSVLWVGLGGLFGLFLLACLTNPKQGGKWALALFGGLLVVSVVIRVFVRMNEQARRREGAEREREQYETAMEEYEAINDYYWNHCWYCYRCDEEFPVYE
jgi:hypothetical protein